MKYGILVNFNSHCAIGASNGNVCQAGPMSKGATDAGPCRRILITNAIHTAFIKYPEGDGGSNLDYEWITPDRSKHIAKAILQNLAVPWGHVAHNRRTPLDPDQRCRSPAANKWRMAKPGLDNKVVRNILFVVSIVLIAWIVSSVW